MTSLYTRVLLYFQTIKLKLRDFFEELDTLNLNVTKSFLIIIDSTSTRLFKNPIFRRNKCHMQTVCHFVFIALFSCTLKKNYHTIQTNQIMKSIKVKQILPSHDSIGNITSIDTSTVQIYYLKGMMLFKIENRYADQTTTNYLTLKFRYSYFSTSDFGKTGYYFDSQDLDNPKLITDNSILKDEWFDIVNLNKLFIDNDFLLLKSDYSEETKEVHEYYEFKDKFDTSFIRRAHFYFKKKKLIHI